jgi:hypothetical protein
LRHDTETSFDLVAGIAPSALPIVGIVGAARRIHSFALAVYSLEEARWALDAFIALELVAVDVKCVGNNPGQAGVLDEPESWVAGDAGSSGFVVVVAVGIDRLADAGRVEVVPGRALDALLLEVESFTANVADNDALEVGGGQKKENSKPEPHWRLWNDLILWTLR